MLKKAIVTIILFIIAFCSIFQINVDPEKEANYNLEKRINSLGAADETILTNSHVAFLLNNYIGIKLLNKDAKKAVLELSFPNTNQATELAEVYYGHSYNLSIASTPIDIQYSMNLIHTKNNDILANVRYIPEYTLNNLKNKLPRIQSRITFIKGWEYSNIINFIISAIVSFSVSVLAGYFVIFITEIDSKTIAIKDDIIILYNQLKNMKIRSIKADIKSHKVKRKRIRKQRRIV